MDEKKPSPLKILIAGSGIAGLGAGLALHGQGRKITLFERDAPPPEGSMDEIFDGWQRPGATQLRHSHVFLARLYALIRDRYPKLLQRLLDAGARELKYHDALPATLRASYRPRVKDGDFVILSCRRTTLEAVIRRYLGELDGVCITAGAKVRGLVLKENKRGPKTASGLKVERDGASARYAGDIVIDASGRNTPFPDWLAAAGIHVPTETADAGIIYYTRHYELREGASEPRGAGSPRAGDLGYIKYGVFIAEDRRFSVTLALPEIERELRMRIVEGDVFDRICASLPGVMHWTHPERARPHGKVHAMGRLRSLWRDWAPNGHPLVLGFFAIGDASLRTNPLYGRGCSTGFLQAHLLAEVLRKTADPIARAKLFALRTQEELRPFYDSMVRQDEAAIRLAKELQRGTYRSGLSPHLARSLAEHGLAPALRRDERVLRSLMRSLHMLQGPDDWMNSPRIVARILLTWATPRPLKNRAYPGRLGPDRSEMLSLIAAR